MLNDITIGQYFPAKSVIHRMDARIKILLLIAVLVMTFVASNAASMMLMVVLVMTAIILSRVPLKIYFRTIKKIWVLILLTAVLNILYVDGEAIFEWGVIEITKEGIVRSVYMAIRIILLIISSAALTYTTSPTQLTDGIERLLKPLSLIGLGGAVHTMAMMMTLALRFIPTLMEETDKIMSAQKARGADLESGGFMQRIKALIPRFVPLLVSSFRRAVELADAMECRCYTGGSGRTRLNNPKAGARDIIASIIVILVIAAVITLNITLKGIIWF